LPPAQVTRDACLKFILFLSSILDFFNAATIFYLLLVVNNDGAAFHFQLKITAMA